jgi:hypothetical protein
MGLVYDTMLSSLLSLITGMFLRQVKSVRRTRSASHVLSIRAMLVFFLALPLTAGASVAPLTNGSEELDGRRIGLGSTHGNLMSPIGNGTNIGATQSVWKRRLGAEDAICDGAGGRYQGYACERMLTQYTTLSACESRCVRTLETLTLNKELIDATAYTLIPLYRTNVYVRVRQ